MLFAGIFLWHFACSLHISGSSQNFLEDFEEAYKCMPIAAKLCLDGINFVDRVFENAKHLTNEFAVHLWVIDLQDPWIIALFPEYGCLDAIYPIVITPILDPPMPNVLISSLQDASSSFQPLVSMQDSSP